MKEIKKTDILLYPRTLLANLNANLPFSGRHTLNFSCTLTQVLMAVSSKSIPVCFFHVPNLPCVFFSKFHIHCTMRLHLCALGFPLSPPHQMNPKLYIAFYFAGTLFDILIYGMLLVILQSLKIAEYIFFLSVIETIHTAYKPLI